MQLKPSFVVLPALLLAGCANVAPPALQPHIAPSGVVIKNFHPAPAVQEQQQRSVAGPPGWPRNLP